MYLKNANCIEFQINFCQKKTNCFELKVKQT